MVNWKSNEQLYFTFTSGYQKNTKPNDYIAHKPRPIVHYRKQYTMNSTSKYYGNHLVSYTNPGGNIVSLKSPSDNCIGFSGVADYMLENKKGCCHTKENPKVIKSGGVEKKRISSNKELLQKRGKTYEKNLPIKKTTMESGYSFTNVYHDCNGVPTKLQKYSKISNIKFFKNGAASASSKILKNRVDAHQKFAKTTGLSRHYVALENATTAPSFSHLSKKVEVPCCVGGI